MKVNAVNFNTNIHTNNLKKSVNNKTNTATEFYNSELPAYNCKNYIVPFTGRKPLPDELPINDISDCYPVNEKGKNTDRLSAVLSTALHYIKPNTPVLLGSSDRNLSFDYIMDIFSDRDLYYGILDEVNSVIFVEDDRIIDDPVLFVKNNNKIGLISDAILIDKDTGKTVTTGYTEITDIDPDTQSIKLINTDIRPISIGEIPDTQDFKFIKRFMWPDVM